MNNRNVQWNPFLGVSEPPVKTYNLCINGTRVWSGDEWPAPYLIDAVSRAAKLTDSQFKFCYADGSTFGY